MDILEHKIIHLKPHIAKQNTYTKTIYALRNFNTVTRNDTRHLREDIICKHFKKLEITYICNLEKLQINVFRAH